jgi:hypothetical protein
MELLLNLAWLLLALPAYWLWRASRTAPAARRFNSAQCLLSLGCLLVILFPVISATDDLRAMRSEMEESPAGKRSICLKTAEKGSTCKLCSQPGLPVASTFSFAMDRESFTLSIPHDPVRPLLHALLPPRGPPVSFLG